MQSNVQTIGLKLSRFFNRPPRPGLGDPPSSSSLREASPRPSCRSPSYPENSLPRTLPYRPLPRGHAQVVADPWPRRSSQQVVGVRECCHMSSNSDNDGSPTRLD